MPSSSTKWADRFQAITAESHRSQVLDDLKKKSFSQLEAMTINFGNTKVGMTYGEVLRTDPKYCQWFLGRYGESTKVNHVPFSHFLKMWVERQELTQGDSPVPGACAKSKAKAKGSGEEPGTPCLPTPPSESESEDDVEIVSSRNWVNDHQASILDRLEEIMSQVVAQLKNLPQGAAPSHQQPDPQGP